jgi:hypothetical protein
MLRRSMPSASSSMAPPRSAASSIRNLRYQSTRMNLESDSRVSWRASAKSKQRDGTSGERKWKRMAVFNFPPVTGASSAGRGRRSPSRAGRRDERRGRESAWVVYSVSECFRVTARLTIARKVGCVVTWALISLSFRIRKTVM